MSPSAIHADNRRITARVVLFMLVAVIVTLVLFSGGPTGAISFAQQQTTSPGPTIKWLNPDAETSNEISAKADRSGAPTGGSYHLVATVNQVPPNPLVTFLYQSGDEEPERIGDATQVGDTFHFHWPGASMPADGAYTLIALLSSNGQAISQDTEEVVVNNTTEDPPVGLDPNTAQSETVEIIDPPIGDVLGFYNRPGDPRYTAVIRVSHSDDVVELLPYYTTSPPGTEPEWVECESGAQDTDESSDGVQCELADPIVPSQVTGVAVVAYDDPTAPAPQPGPTKESGDAHRVFGYEAIPTSFTLQGAGTSVPPGTCSPVITATLFDQNGNAIGGANVDVHGQGPNDNLRFDDSDETGNTSSSHKPPENHPTESARDCETTNNPPTDGSQGWHAETGSDRKHIESTDGTNDDGTFKFRFYSPVSGVTQYTIWSDDDGNDRLCTLEAQKDGAVGWGQAPPANPSGVADEDATCVRPGQSSTTPATETTTPPPSETPSTPPPSSSPTTASPSPSSSTPTRSPSPTSSTGTPSPSPSTASPTRTDTTPAPPVVYPSTTTIKYNGKAFLGKVKAGHNKCRKGRSVLLKKKKPGKDKTVGKDRTNRQGRYKIREPRANGNYYTVAKAKGFTDGSGRPVTCAKDRSKTKRV